MPNSPKRLSPQHSTVPPEISAQVYESPAEMAVTPVRPVTLTGTLELVLDPLPNGPPALFPQHWTVPPESTAQVWNWPEVTSDGCVPTVTFTLGLAYVVLAPVANNLKE